MRKVNFPAFFYFFILGTLLVLVFAHIGQSINSLSSNKVVSQKEITSSSNNVTLTAKEKPTTTLIATGDVMLGRSVYGKILSEGDIYYPFKKTKNLLEGAGITLINLENPFYDPCPTVNSGMTFCAPTNVAELLSNSGIDVANIANNHIKNYGEKGYETTIEALRVNKILPSDETNFAQVERNGTKFGFIGFNDVGGILDVSLITENVSKKNTLVDVLIVSFHWGEEYKFVNNSRQVLLAHAVIDSGADLVIGHHPHVIQPVEFYKDVLIVYSLGNFVFDQMWSEMTKEGVVGKFTFKEKKLISHEFIPIYIGNIGQPEIVSNTTLSKKLINRLSE